MSTPSGSARDRATEVGALALAHHVNDRQPDDGAYDLASVVVDALLAHPDVLRALAGDTAPAEAPPTVIRLHCERHHTHDVTSLQAAQIVAALAVDVANLREDPPEADGDAVPVCPLDALSWAHDGEMYAEYVEARLLGTGIARLDDEEGLVLAGAGAPEVDR